MIHKDEQKASRKSRWYPEHTKSLELILNKTREVSYAFPEGIWAMLESAIPDFNGKKVLVPSSGDNFAAFIFSFLGADVTSTDIEQERLDEAQIRAKEYALANMHFENIDTMTLDGLPDNEYDLIFTSNGTYHSLCDITKVHSAFYRALKPGGVYCFYECHPFYSRGIEEEIDTSTAFYKGTGELTFSSERYKTQCSRGYSFYTIEDYINSLLKNNFVMTDFCDIRTRKDEIPVLDCKGGIRLITKQKLPSWMGISAIKSNQTPKP